MKPFDAKKEAELAVRGVNPYDLSDCVRPIVWTDKGDILLEEKFVGMSPTLDSITERIICRVAAALQSAFEAGQQLAKGEINMGHDKTAFDIGWNAAIDDIAVRISNGIYDVYAKETPRWAHELVRQVRSMKRKGSE